MLEISDIKSVLTDVKDPNLDISIVEAGWLTSVSCDDNIVSVIITLGYPSKESRDYLKEEVNKVLIAKFPQFSFKVDVLFRIHRHQLKRQVSAHPKIKNVIAVASGKGGVGKSTTSVNLALALKAQGANVGILDGDIYGPSQSLLLGPLTLGEKTSQGNLIPAQYCGICVMSMGLIVDLEVPMVLRGPMISNALMQLFNDTKWPELDYLILDLPPGTGDIQLTMAQKLPITGCIIVTTPQEMALMDVKRSIMMFEKLDVPILGIIENMSEYHCPCCNHKEALFGEGGGAQLAKRFNVPLLGSLPLIKEIREHSDGGFPIVVAKPQCSISKSYNDMAIKFAANLGCSKRDYNLSSKVVLT